MNEKSQTVETSPMNDQISWCVELAVKPGELDNFRELTIEMMESTRSDAGVLIYGRFLSEDGKTVYLYSPHGRAWNVADAACVGSDAGSVRHDVSFRTA